MTWISHRRAGATCSALLLTFALAPGADAQVRPVGAPPISPRAIQDRLGACPVEAMRAAWADMDALERVAVEQEVLRLCTERAVLVGEFLAAHRDLRAALGELVPGLPAPAVVPAVADAGETSSAAVPGPDVAATEDAPPDEPGTVSVAGPPGNGAGDREIVDLPPPGAASQTAVLAGGGTAPSVPEPSWEVLFTAKRSDGAWLAMIRETYPAPLALPALLPADGETAVELPPVHVPRPPESVLLSEGELLAAGGPMVVRIDGLGVEIAEGAEGEAVALPWASGASATEPGRPDFLYLKEED